MGMLESQQITTYLVLQSCHDLFILFFFQYMKAFILGLLLVSLWGLFAATKVPYVQLYESFQFIKVLPTKKMAWTKISIAWKF